jgi:hypothetical protein
LTPDNTGNYVNGTWTQLASLPGHYGPEYYASAVLPDGRLIVEGGEYNFGAGTHTTLGAIYDSTSNTWTSMTPPSGWSTIGDAQSTVLTNGTFMLANCCTTQQVQLNASTLTWTTTGTGKADSNNEEGWTLMPNGLVLTVDANNVTMPTHAEKYTPKTGTWASAGSTIVTLADPSSHELGPAVLRPDGTVFYTGATGKTAIYTVSTGVWTVGPNFPIQGGKQLDIADGPAALLPSGNVFCQASPGVFFAPSTFFEFDGTNLTPVVAPPNAPNDPSFVGRMVVLPTGQVFWVDGSKDVEIYTPTGSPNPSWAPNITSVATTLTRGATVVIKGTQFNGLSQGAAYGDDSQSASNYPLVRIMNNATHHVFYARTHNHTSMGVATGSRIVGTHFDVPSGMETGASTLVVVANGIASNTVAVTVN